MSLLSRLGIRGGVNLQKRFEFKLGVELRCGRVVPGREKSTGRKVGLKLINAKKAEATREKLKVPYLPTEGEIACAIDSPHVVSSFEHGITRDGDEFILQEWIDDGLSLEFLIDRQDRTLAANCKSLVKQIAKGLMAIHDAGFVHRDVCPRNIIWDRKEKRLKLADFGMSIPNIQQLKLANNRSGRPLYMAPEIMRRKPCDHRVDIFSFGVTCYQICTFQHPWGVTESSPNSTLLFDSKLPRDALEVAPDMSAVLASAIMRCLNPKPEQRIPSIKHFLVALAGK